MSFINLEHKLRRNTTLEYDKINNLFNDSA
jgi:hypothetical protein